MPFRPVASEKLSSAVVRQIEELILRGILRPGERLPSERDLADRLKVSRPSLRDALGALQGQGLLSARPGAGVYVADVLGSSFSPALRDLMSRHDQAVFDYLDFQYDDFRDVTKDGYLPGQEPLYEFDAWVTRASIVIEY